MSINLHIELAERRREAENYAKTLEQRVIERTSELYQTRKALILSLASLAESRDHLQPDQSLCREWGRPLGHRRCIRGFAMDKIQTASLQ